MAGFYSGLTAINLDTIKAEEIGRGSCAVNGLKGNPPDLRKAKELLRETNLHMGNHPAVTQLMIAALWALIEELEKQK